MSNCYRCGRRLPEVSLRRRRRIKTGEWVRRKYPRKRVDSLNVHYGMRIVCPLCAREMDRLRAWEETKRNLLPILALLALLAVLLFAQTYP